MIFKMIRIEFIGIFLTSILFGQTLFAQNYDESKVGSYTLPELLKTQDGQTISTVDEWEKVRRPEILKLFEDHVYGQVPKDYDDIKFRIKNTDKKAMGGKATLKEIEITVFRNQKTATINLLLFTPNQVKKPVPVFLVLNHRGIKTMDVTRENKDGFWPAEEVIEAGYGIAGFDVVDFAPDHKENFSQGVLDQLYPEQLAMNNGMRALGAWGWGASRAIDYFETDRLVDATKVITVGHSRGGKASLWCGAQDQRVAITISNESGNSGAALSRRNFGETVERIVTTFPYWFCPNYRQYGNNEEKLPVDQHMLIGLIAPRAVYVASAAEDLWADPKGQYLALKEAQPVYRLYGFETNLPEEMPEVNQQVIRPAMGFHNREGKHNMTPFDWQQFIRFADYWFKK
ncbi:MAG: alpha/beta hydrolase [Bacteroidia bacterium]|nr:alpha/beta hydrolase [Bacteroidia bacterium]